MGILYLHFIDFHSKIQRATNETEQEITGSKRKRRSPETTMADRGKIKFHLMKDDTVLQ